MAEEEQNAERVQGRLRPPERAHHPEAGEREFLDLLLGAIGSVAMQEDRSTRAVLRALRDTLEISDAIVVTGRPSGGFEAIAASTDEVLEVRWPDGPEVESLRRGELVVAADAQTHPLWMAQPEESRNGVGSAIHVPLLTGRLPELLVLTHDERAHFGPQHVRLLERFGPLVAQVLSAARVEAVEAEAAELRAEHEVLDALSESSSRLATLLRSMHSAVLVEDEAGLIVLANDEFCKVFAASTDGSELEGTECAAVMRKGARAFSDPNAFLERLGELLAGGRPVKDEVLHTADGRTLLRDFIPLDIDGQPRGSLWQYRDVTDQRASEALNRAIVTTALDGVITIDHRGHIIEFNPSAEKIFGHRRSDVLGRPMRDVIIPPELRDAHDRGMARYLASGEARILGQRLELTAVRADGTVFPVELTVNRIPGSEPPAFTGFVRDITEAKQRAAELERARDAAEQASAAKSDFLAMMSHEIRTPMNAILGMTELSIDMAEGAEQQGLLRAVQSNAESLLHVINDVLDLSKVEAGRLGLRTEVFSVADIMESVTEALAPRAFEKGLELSCSVDPALSVPVEGDPNRLRQILVNLLGNAVKFTDDGEVALVGHGTEDPDGKLQVHLSVHDTGIGMSSEDLDKIFDPFFQADASLSRDFGGTGLGLSISNSLVELMGGRLRVESARGDGSAFHAQIPFERSKQAFARRRASDARYERWQAWIVTPTDALAGAVELAYDSVHIPSARVGLEELKDGLARSENIKHVIVVDQRMGVAVLEAVAAAARETSSRADVRLCVLVPPGPIEPWKVHGPPNTVYVTKPASRRKLCSVVADDPEEVRDVVRGNREDRQEHSGRVLLVEDNPANQQYAIRVLEDAGYNVTLAEDGVAGLAEATEGEFDLILTDLDMPRKDGIEMTRDIVERLGDDTPPILAFTAHVVEGFRERCEEVGMVGFVAKPARPADLLQQVREHARRGPTLLIVDDSADNRELTRRILEREHLSLEFFEDGRAAIERVREGGVAGLLLDMNMPGLDGYETARRIRALPVGHSIPILAMTSWVGPDEEARCIEAGCTAYIDKPLRRDALVAAVATLLSGPMTEVDDTDRPHSVRVDPIIADLVPGYLSARLDDVGALRKSLGEGDLESIRVLAHNLAGSGEAYGFSRLSELGRALEDVTGAGDREEVSVWIDEIERYLETVEWEVDEEA